MVQHINRSVAPNQLFQVPGVKQQLTEFIFNIGNDVPQPSHSKNNAYESNNGASFYNPRGNTFRTSQSLSSSNLYGAPNANGGIPRR